MKLFIKTILFCSLLNFVTDKNVIKLLGKPEIFTTDKLGNIYVYNDNLLKKISKDGKILGQYSSLESGKLHSVDASDPMQVLLFYKGFNQLELIDNKLNQIGKAFYFDLLNLSSVTAVCKSKQFAVWIFDEYEEKLIRYGFNPKGTLQIINLDKYKEELGNVEFMLESGNDIYLKGKDGYIWIFDEFGTKLNKIKLEMNGDFQLRNNNLVFRSGNQMIRYNAQNGYTDSAKIGHFIDFDKARIENNILYILNNDSISLFQFDKLK